MSVNSIRAALETAVNGISPALSTAWENVPFEPVQGTPYQAVYLLLATPENIEFGDVFRQIGILQISLFYPLETGSSSAMTRAELIRSTFKRGNSYSSGGVSVIISRTPDIKPAMRDGDRYHLIIDIPFFSHVIS